MTLAWLDQLGYIHGSPNLEVEKDKIYHVEIHTCYQERLGRTRCDPEGRGRQERESSNGLELEIKI